MSRQAGVRYVERSEDEDYEYSRSNDGQTVYWHYDREEKAREMQARMAHSRAARQEQAREMQARLAHSRAARPSSVPQPPSPIRTTASREPARARLLYSSNEGSGEDDEVIKAQGRTYVFNDNETGSNRKHVSGHNLLGHSTASKLRRQGPRALSDVCNKNTISKDNTVGNQAQMDELLATFGKKVFGMHCHELPRQSSPHTEPGHRCEYCLTTFDTRRQESLHRIYLRPSDPSRGRCKTWEEFYDEKNSNSHRKQRQQLDQDEYGDEVHTALPDKGPPLNPEKYPSMESMAWDYIQASKVRVATDEYAKAVRDAESVYDSSDSEDGAESEELSDSEYGKPTTVRSRQIRVPMAPRY